MPIDSSDRTHLPVCPCGWRGNIVGSRAAAQHDLDEHRISVHDAPFSSTRAWRDENRA